MYYDTNHFWLLTITKVKTSTMTRITTTTTLMKRTTVAATIPMTTTMTLMTTTVTLTLFDPGEGGEGGVDLPPPPATAYTCKKLMIIFVYY